MQGPISTVLGLKYPHNTILVIDTKHNFISVSARRGDGKIAVNTLLEKAIEGLKGSNAGGHVQAAGAGLNKKDYSVFKKRVIELAGA
jgi:single-stranded DNA-specific DHH superfamily exonuclease